MRTEIITLIDLGSAELHSLSVSHQVNLIFLVAALLINLIMTNSIYWINLHQLSVQSRRNWDVSVGSRWEQITVSRSLRWYAVFLSLLFVARLLMWFFLTALLGTATVVSVLAVGMAFVPPRILRKMFPPLVTGSMCSSLAKRQGGINFGVLPQWFYFLLEWLSSLVVSTTGLVSVVSLLLVKRGSHSNSFIIQAGRGRVCMIQP